MTATTTKQIVPQNDTQDALYQNGYRAFVVDGSLFVRKPDGTRYIVNPAKQTCSCPASVTCKHLKGLTSLVFLSMGQLSREGKWAAYDALCDYWFQYTSGIGAGR